MSKTRSFSVTYGILAIFSFMAFVVIGYSPSFGEKTFSLNLIPDDVSFKYYFLLLPGFLSTIFFWLLGRIYFSGKKLKEFTIMFILGLFVGFILLLWNVSPPFFLFHGFKSFFNCTVGMAFIAFILANVPSNPIEKEK